MSIRCPNCGCASKVYDTRRAEARVRRKRSCLSCGHHFITVEIADTEFDDSITLAMAKAEAA